jgi:single-strand DNA-binding protein
MPTGPQRMTYSVEEVAAILGVSKTKIYDTVRAGELRAVQLGRRVVIPSDVLEALVGPIGTPESRAAASALDTRSKDAFHDTRGAEMNAVHLTGTIVRQPELRLSRTGLEVCTLQLAVPRRRRDGEERGALHVDIVAFGTTAETAAEIARGEHVAVSGRLGQREWTSSDGSQHARFEVIADEVERTGPVDASRARMA